MKNITKQATLLLSLLFISFISAQTPEGTWKFSPEAGAFKVGPSQGTGDYFTSSAADVATRDCLFDDEYVFNADGSFNNVLGTDTWLETWQAGPPTEGCGTPIAPHDGTNPATWSYDVSANTITIIGDGAFLGLAKVTNTNELGDPANDTTTYIVSSITSTNMTLDIQLGNGAWWRFLFTKDTGASGDASLNNLEVDSATISGFDSNVTSYSYSVPVGASIPQITAATPTSSFSQTLVTQATSIPGDATVVVTAPDGTTTRTYTVSFLYAPATGPSAPPAREVGDVISIFSDAYTDITGANYNPNWGQSGFGSANTSYDPGDGNTLLAYTNFNYQGIDFSGNAQDASGMEYLHIDLWTPADPNATTIQVSPINNGTGTGEVLTTITYTTGTWTSVDIPIADFTGQTWDSVIQMKFAANGAGSVSPVDIYLDNIYFWKEPTVAGSDATLSDLQVDSATISGFVASATSYTYGLVDGTTTVPQITAATPTDANAQTSITQATSIPGDATVVVTAQDGTTTQTYTVSYFYSSPATGPSAPPAREVGDVISIFSDAYTDITGANYNPNWGQSGFGSANTSYDPGDGNTLLAYTNFNYQGIDFSGNAQDASGMEYLHIDLWTPADPNATTIQVSPINNGTGTGEVLTTITYTTGTWTSVDIPIADFTGQTWDSVIQMKFAANGAGSVSPVDIYLDNIYFWKSAAGSDATLSDLQVDSATVSGFVASTTSYTYGVAAGASIPQITAATPTDANAQTSITQATSIPGDATVVVTAQDGTTTQTYTVSYFYSSPATGPSAPPAREVGDVISIFSDAYTDITGANYNPNWGQSGFGSANTSYDPGDGNTLLAYTNFNYQGIDFSGNAQDASGMEYLHIDLWTPADPNATTIQVSPINNGTGTGEVLTTITYTTGTWTSVDIPIADFTGQTWDSVIQMKFAANGAGSVSPVDIYLDNIYFWKEPTVAGSDATLSDLQVDSATISGFVASATSYTYGLVDGTTTVPQITAATPTDANAQTSITQATSIPGDATVVVTAQDGTTTQTYTVSYFYSSPATGPSAPPAREVGDVISIFSDAYTDITGANYNPNWGQSGFGSANTSYDPGDGNTLLAYTNFNYQGIDFSGNAQDASGMEYLHIDLWTPADPNATTIQVSPINNGTGTGEVLTTITYTTGTWTSVDIPIADFTGQTWDSVIQMKFAANGAGSVSPVDIYLDNIYFWKSAAGSDATLSDLQVDSATVSGFVASTTSYTYGVAAGASIPQITAATPTDANAQTSITQATSIPGDATVVVTAQDGTTTQTYTISYFYSSPATGPSAPPAREVGDVISIFSDAYTDITGANYNPNWGQSGFGSANTSYDPGDGNTLLAYTNFNYQGIDFSGNAQDASGMEYLHIDLWTPADPNATTIQVSPINNGTGTGEVLTTITYTTGTWTSVDIPIADFTGQTWDSVIQMKFAANGAGSVSPVDIYLDNIYFWKEPTVAGSDATLSDLQVDSATISGFVASATSYTYGLVDGTTTVPQITAATPTDANAQTSITQATSIPGDATVVVTAQDGTTTQTYTVSYFYSSPATGPSAPPAREVGDVISIFSDAYTDITGANYNPNWGQSGFGSANTSYDPGDGNTLLAYTNFNYQGIDFSGNAQDASGMEYLHIDLWTPADPNATTIQVSPINNGTGTGEVLTTITYTTGTWTSVDIPIADFTGQTWDSVIQMKFAANGAGSVSPVDIYLDNIYFWKSAAGSDATLSDLQVDSATVSGFVASTTSYTYGVAAGASIPQITAATPTDANAQTSITQATSIPGDATVVVTAQDGTTTQTYTISYFYSSPATGPSAPPSREVGDVISIFSDAYTDITGANYNPNWGQSGFGSANTSYDPGDGNTLLAYTNFNYQGIDFSGNAQDASGMEYLHIDLWTPADPNATTIQVSPINNGTGTGEVLTTITYTTGTWTSVDIPIADFTGQTWDSVIQMKFAANGAGSVSPVDIYLDNIYFWKEPTVAGSDATLSDLQVDSATISGFVASATSYTYGLVDGTTTVPQITAATPTDANAQTSITQATSIPGDATVVVTAQDGTTTQTYTVSYFYSSPATGPSAPPAREVGDVISIFSDAYTDITGANYNPNWGQSGFGSANTSYDPGDGNTLLAYTNFNYQGIDFSGNAQDASGMEYLHIDLWTPADPNATTIQVSPINNGTGTGEVLTTITYTTGTWTSVDIPIADFTGQTWDSVIQMKFAANGAGSVSPVDIYLDNIYFWKSAAGSDATLSDLQVDSATVSGFVASTTSYTYGVAAGASIPQITAATPTDANAQTSITQATSIPGDATVVVTAQDGTTTQTYTVSYFYSSPATGPSAPPAREVGDVISIFSDAYTDIAGTDFNPNWGQSGFDSANTSYDPGDGNTLLAYTNFNYQGMQLGTGPDASDMEYLHIDLWTPADPNATTIQVSPINNGTGVVEVLTTITYTTGTWTSVDIPIADFTGQTWDAIKQMKFAANGEGSVSPVDIYLDNIYFWKSPICSGTSTTWDGIAWSNGQPDANSYVIINGPYNTGSIGNIDACSLQIDSSLTVDALGYINVDGDITINPTGSLTVAHTGSVVQVQETATTTNGGAISVLVDTPDLDILDFMVMGSPMSAETRESVWASAWNVQDHTTANFNSIAGITGFNFLDEELDDWNLYVTGVLSAGEGYLVRPQDSYNGAGGVFNYDFNAGTLNSGVVTQTLDFNATDLESPNMLSNPYASAIDADALLAANPEFDALYFWEHNTAPSTAYPGANSVGNNYSMDDVSLYNALGGTAATSGGAAPNGVIATGQGFGVFATAGGTATFNNAMRLTSGNTTLRNNPISRDRLWLNVNSTVYNVSGNTLLGFVADATQGIDRKYDNGRVASKVSLYSHIQGSDRGYSIQAREAFEDSMTIALGFSSIIEEVTSYKISLSDFDGEAWLEATPYLVDNQTGVITNLMEDSYSFTSDMGEFNDRFEIVFQDRSLGSQESLASSIAMYPNPASDVVTIASPTAAITTVAVRDIRGRLILGKAVASKNITTLDVASLDSALYLVTITTDSGSITSRLIIK